jgi:hypothetical protein
MYLVPASPRHLASPALRDRFLIALDERDEAAIRSTVRDLLGCANSLPTTTCILLGLPPGSTYGDAAETITKAQCGRPDAA